ncbi:Prenylated Rab acceptor 1 [Tilletia horrida]|nr:Prenylated Rab acceptor 1 [Tilletia horrida]
MAQLLSVAAQVPEYIRSFRRERLSGFRPLNEFFDYQRISRPQDTNEAFQRITYNTRYFSGNYAVVIGILAVYGLLPSRAHLAITAEWMVRLTSPWFLVAVGFLVGGFAAINRFAPEPMQVGEHLVTQKSLYTGLFVIGIPLLWFASPFSLLFWLIGSSAFIILGHAAFIEPPVASEYSNVETV